jgi:cobaltochelatase CobN
MDAHSTSSSTALNALRNEDQMNVLIAGEMSKAKVIVVRCTGRSVAFPV